MNSTQLSIWSCSLNSGRFWIFHFQLKFIFLGYITVFQFIRNKIFSICFQLHTRYTQIEIFEKKDKLAILGYKVHFQPNISFYCQNDIIFTFLQFHYQIWAFRVVLLLKGHIFLNNWPKPAMSFHLLYLPFILHKSPNSSSNEATFSACNLSSITEYDQIEIFQKSN